MRETFRLSMAYMHTWLGLMLGFVLMAVFFFGSLSVFDQEIDRWSVPETRAAVTPMPSFDRRIAPLISQIHPSQRDMQEAAKEVVGAVPPISKLKVSALGVYSSHRDPLVYIFKTYDLPNKPRDWSVEHVHVYGYTAIKPTTGGRVAPDVQNRVALGTGFFFPMHYMLHLSWKDVGLWIVGFAGMTMLAALLSGIIMHRRIFREFFTFRPDRARLRSTLDLHNLTGVVALPFLFLITFSGLLLFASTYFASPTLLMHPLMKVQERIEQARTGLPAEPSDRPGGLASVDAMMTAAKAHWAAQGVPGEVGAVGITHFGDDNAYVSIERDRVDRVASAEILHFKGSTGELLYENPPAPPIEALSGFLSALHLQWFKHWPLRWLLFTGGLLGCACITTGFLFFVEKRKRKHATATLPGARIADALAVTTVTGMLIATSSIMLASKLLPPALQNQETGWLAPIFWLTWLAALIHAAARSHPVAAGHGNPAWAEQLWVAALVAVAAAVANWIATGDNLYKTIKEGYWPVAGTDLVLLLGAAVAAWTAKRLNKPRRAVPRKLTAPVLDLVAAE